MSKNEILMELPTLSAAEREEIRQKLNALEVVSAEWLDGGELTDEEKRILEQRLDDYDKNPGDGSSWEEVQGRVRAKLRRE